MLARFKAQFIDRYRVILGDGIWVAGGQVATGLLNLAGNRLVTQIVSPELYGVVNLVQNALLFVRSLFCSPLLGATVRYLPEAEQKGYAGALRAMVTRLLTWAVLGSVAMTVVGGLAWSRSTRVPPVVCVVLAVMVVADVGRTLQFTLLNVARQQRPLAILSALEALARPLLIIVGVLLVGATVPVVLGAIAVSILVPLFSASLVGGTRASAGQGALPAGLMDEMRRYALPLLPLALINWVVSVSDRYIIGWICDDPSSVGVYAAGYGLISQPFILVQAIITLTLRPVYFAAVAGGNDERARRTFRVWLTVSFGTCAFIAAVVVVARTPLVGLLLGPRYQGAVVVVPWIALGYWIYVFDQALEQQLLAHKRTTAVVIAQAAGALASVLITIPLVEQYGMVGAAYACPLYFLVQCLVAANFLRSNRREPRSG